MPLGPSELILNADNSIYHLNLLPSDLAHTVILVGDQNRVEKVSRYFDTIEIRKQRREFITHTGYFNNKRLTVLSSGIGTDNIDIVLNEIDALVNIDLNTREVKEDKISLEIVRIGTSGALHADIEVGSFILSEFSIGFDNVLHYYDSESVQYPDAQMAFVEHANWSVYKSVPYVVKGDEAFTKKLFSNKVTLGFTGSNVGFYGPQGRRLRLALEDEELNEKLKTFRYKGKRITNLEMETSAIFGLSALMGHKAASMNCILANRDSGEFSSNPAADIDAIIRYTLEKLTTN